MMNRKKKKKKKGKKNEPEVDEFPIFIQSTVGEP
jgi:hypothetical protein